MRRAKIRNYERLSFFIAYLMFILVYAGVFVFAYLGDIGCPKDQITDAMVGIGVTLLVLLIAECMVRIRLLGLREAERAFREACHVRSTTYVKPQRVKYIDCDIIRNRKL